MSIDYDAPTGREVRQQSSFIKRSSEKEKMKAAISYAHLANAMVRERQLQSIKPIERVIKDCRKKVSPLYMKDYDVAVRDLLEDYIRNIFTT